MKSLLSVTVRDVSYNFYQKNKKKSFNIKTFLEVVANKWQKKIKYWEKTFIKQTAESTH